MGVTEDTSRSMARQGVTVEAETRQVPCKSRVLQGPRHQEAADRVQKGTGGIHTSADRGPQKGTSQILLGMDYRWLSLCRWAGHHQVTGWYPQSCR